MPRVPFNVGEVIEYCGVKAEVVSDTGGKSLGVCVDGSFQSWLFELEGMQCQLAAPISIRGFHHYNEAYYSKNLPLPNGAVDEVMIGIYHKEGGTSGEFSVRWKIVSGRPVPQLQAFSDSWKVFPQFSDLLELLATLDESTTPEKFCEELVRLGMKDLTKRERE